jgi:hypothetical protein
MAHDMELDAILASLARPEMAGSSDRLLDLRQAAQSPPEAGRCMRNYFELVAEAPDNGSLDRPLAALREWLERHLSIEVLDEAHMIHLERLPLRIRGAKDLSSFCRGAMKDFVNDRCHSAPRIRMQFGFVERA